MKKLLLILALIVLFGACEKEPVTEKEIDLDDIELIYYHGDIEIVFPLDANSFRTLMDMGYNAIDGNLSLRDLSHAGDLDFLNQLYVVTGNVSISEVDYPKDLLESLVEVGGSITLSDLYNFDDFYNLKSVQGITIQRSYFMTIEGFENLDSCEYIILKDHHGQVNQFNAFPSLQKTGLLHLNLNQQASNEFKGLKNLRSCRHLILESAGMNTLPHLEVIEDRLDIIGLLGTNSLASCPGSDTLTIVDGKDLGTNTFANPYTAKTVDIEFCQDIEDLNWTRILDSVANLRVIDCNELVSLEGLEEQDLLDTLICERNDSLKDYCSVSDLDIDSLYTRFNAYNPSWEEIQNGLCLMPEEE